MTHPPVIDEARFRKVLAEWQRITELPTPSVDRFAEVKREASALIAAGRWTSGPSDMLSVLGRQRDELIHSRLIAWLLVPTNQHGLGRAVLSRLVEHLWPGERLLESGAVTAQTEVNGGGLDEAGTWHEARADIVLTGDGVTVIIENKLDAGEQPDQCERQYWAWAAEPGDIRWVFLTPSGRSPMTVTSDAAKAAWRTLSYADLRRILASALDDAGTAPTSGRATASQYLATLRSTGEGM